MRAEIWLPIISNPRQVTSAVSIANPFIHNKNLLDPTQISISGDNKPLLLFFLVVFAIAKRYDSRSYCEA